MIEMNKKNEYDVKTNDIKLKLYKDSFKHNDSKIGLKAFVNKDKHQF